MSDTHFYNTMDVILQLVVKNIVLAKCSNLPFPTKALPSMNEL